ncbi:MAG: hypothetical protein JWQ08_1667 [Deinococcus sp.]|nr:hypothetical protein [Deinococcus sp.]
MWRTGLITAAILLLTLGGLAALVFGVLAGSTLQDLLAAPVDPVETAVLSAVFAGFFLYFLLGTVCLIGVIRDAWYSRDIRLGRTWPVLIGMTTPKWMLLRPWVWFLAAVPLLLETLQAQAQRKEGQVEMR